MQSSRRPVDRWHAWTSPPRVIVRASGQLNRIPLIREDGIVAPVENIVTAPVFLVLPRRSLSPGSIVIVYAVFFLHPRRGRTEISSRCQSTRGSPSLGEMRKSPSSDAAPEGRSLTTSSKRKITSFGVVPVFALSGATFTICGASCM